MPDPLLEHRRKLGLEGLRLSRDRPQDTITAFIRAMNIWERHCIEAGEPDDDMLDAVMERFADTALMSEVTYFDPPAYDPGAELVTKGTIVGKRSAEVETLDSTGSKPIERQYVLHLKTGVWRLKYRLRLGADGEWVREPI